MHLSIEELLAVRDGEPDARAPQHLASCRACSAELERLQAVRAQLAALPGETPERDLWPALRAAASAQRSYRRWRRAGWAAAAAAAIFTVVIGVRGGLEAWHESRLARQTRALVAESQRLEKALRSGETGGRVVNAGTAYTIAEIQDRIALIDMEINRSGSGTLASNDVLKLWQERVQLLDALVNVQATRTAYVGL